MKRMTNRTIIALFALLLFTGTARADVCLFTEHYSSIALNIKKDLQSIYTEDTLRFLGEDDFNKNTVNDCSFLNITIGKVPLSKWLNWNKKAIPTIATYLTQAEFDSLFAQQSEKPNHVTAIFHDPLLIRQILLGSIILPNAKSFAILVSNNKKDQYFDLMKKMANQGLTGRIYNVDNSNTFSQVLRHAIQETDYIVGTLDRNIYNRRNIKHLLLTAYRQNRFLIGPTKPYVQAGAIASTNTSTHQIAIQIKDAIVSFNDNKRLPPPAHARDYMVSVNRQVARSLNIPILPSDELKTLLELRLQEGDK